MKKLKLKLLNFPKVIELVNGSTRYNKHSPPDSSGQAPNYSVLLWFYECSFLSIVHSSKTTGPRKGIFIWWPTESGQSRLFSAYLIPTPALGNTWDIWHQHEWQSTWLSPVNCLPRQTRVFSFSLCIRSYSQVAGRHTVQFIWQQEPCWAASQAPQISFKGGVHQCNETGWKACVRERWGGQEEKRRRQPWPLLLSLLS